MTIGERIKYKRIEKGWSQRELSNRMGYQNHSTITKIEAGTVDLSQTRLKQFADVLNTTVSYLMGWTEKIEKEPVKMAEHHFEILMDEDISDLFEEFKTLDSKQRQLVKDLVHSLAATKKEV